MKGIVAEIKKTCRENLRRVRGRGGTEVAFDFRLEGDVV